MPHVVYGDIADDDEVFKDPEKVLRELTIAKHNGAVINEDRAYVAAVLVTGVGLHHVGGIDLDTVERLLHQDWQARVTLTADSIEVTLERPEGEAGVDGSDSAS